MGDDLWPLYAIQFLLPFSLTKLILVLWQTKAVLDVAGQIKRVVLLSGTPSLSRSYILPIKFFCKFVSGFCTWVIVKS